MTPSYFNNFEEDFKSLRPIMDNDFAVEHLLDVADEIGVWIALHTEPHTIANMRKIADVFYDRMSRNAFKLEKYRINPAPDYDPKQNKL